MAALTTNRATPNSSPIKYEFEGPVTAAVHIFHGAAVGLDAAGNIRPMVPSVTLKALGVAQAERNNAAGVAGDLRVDVQAGAFWFKNSARAAITRADLLNQCFFDDDQTVARDNNSAASQTAGRVLAVDAVEGILVGVNIF